MLLGYTITKRDTFSRNVKQLGREIDAVGRLSINLCSTVEQKGGKINMGEFRIELEQFIDASREEIFKALTKNVGDWWEFCVAPKGISSFFTFDPVPGGKFIENWGENEGAVWGKVYYVHSPTEIRLFGHLGMQGAINSAYTYRLLEKDGGTLLQLSHTASGVIYEQWEQEHLEGWDYLLGTLLKNYVEKS